MSTRGRKPNPSAVSKLRGNPGKRKVNKNEPRPKTAVTRPYGLGKGLQDRFWREHAGELERLNILTGVDTAAFRLMADHYSIAVDAVQQLRESGLTVEGRDGPKKNPLAQIFRDNSMAFKSFATEFGMTPSARSRLQLPDDAEQLSLADALFAAVQNAEMENVESD